MKLSLPKRVTVVEVSPRDGLQNEAIAVPTSTKIKLIDRLSETGLTTIESTAFVSAKQVPQLSDAETVMHGLRRKPGVSYPVLVPNLRGLERAVAAGARDIAVFTGASGNVATEDVVYMLQGMEIETGIDLPKLIKTGRFISALLGRENTSRV